MERPPGASVPPERAGDRRGDRRLGCGSAIWGRFVGRGAVAIHIRTQGEGGKMGRYAGVGLRKRCIENLSRAPRKQINPEKQKTEFKTCLMQKHTKKSLAAWGPGGEASVMGSKFDRAP